MRRPLYLLIERQHLTQVLLETRIEFLRQKYIPLLNATFNNPNDSDRALELSQAIDGEAVDEIDANFVFDWAVKLDPSPTKKYTQWVLTGLLKRWWPPEDSYKVSEYLDQFEKVQRHLPVEQRDINRYRSLPALYAAMEPHLQAQSQREVDRELDRRMHAEAKVLLDTPEYKIVTPLTQEASCYFGRNTQWCTAATSSWNAFKDYNKQGPLYIVLDKKHNQRWQFHEKTGQYMDENDRMINLDYFVRTHPVVAKFFAQHDGKALGQFYGGIALAQPEGGFIVKDKRGLLGRTLLIVGVNEHNELVKIHDPSVSGFDFGRQFLRGDTPTQFCALLNRLKITGGSRPGLRLFFGKGRWAPDIETVGDKVIGDWYRVWMDVTFTSPNGYPYYGLVQNGGLVLAATTHANAIRFTDASSQGPILRPSRHRPTMLADAKHFEKVAVDLVLHLPEIKDWSEEGVFDTRHISTEQVKRLLDAKPDFQVSMSAYLPIFGVTDELKAHLGKALERVLPGEEATWFGDRLLVDVQRNLHEYLMRGAVGLPGLGMIDAVYHEAGRLHASNAIYKQGAQQILSRIPSKTRMRIGKQLQRYAPEYVDHYDPLSAADIWKVIDLGSDDMDVAERESEGGKRCLEWYHLLSDAIWAGAEHSFMTVLNSIIGRHVPDEVFFRQEDGRYTKDVDLFGPVALLAPAEKLVLLYDTDATALLSSPWPKILDIKFDLSSLANGIPPDEFDLTVATASFLAKLPAAFHA